MPRLWNRKIIIKGLLLPKDRKLSFDIFVVNNMELPVLRFIFPSVKKSLFSKKVISQKAKEDQFLKGLKNLIKSKSVVAKLVWKN